MYVNNLWDILPSDCKLIINEYKIHYNSKVINEGKEILKKIIYNDRKFINSCEESIENIKGIDYYLKTEINNFDDIVSDFYNTSYTVFSDTRQLIEHNEIINLKAYKYRQSIFKNFILFRFLTNIDNIDTDNINNIDNINYSKKLNKKSKSNINISNFSDNINTITIN